MTFLPQTAFEWVVLFSNSIPVKCNFRVWLQFPEGKHSKGFFMKGRRIGTSQDRSTTSVDIRLGKNVPAILNEALALRSLVVPEDDENMR